MDLFFWRNIDEHNTWKRKEGGIAQVIDGDELKGITWQTFVVLPGTRCLFIDNGVSQGELEPGKYTAESLYQRFTQLRLKSAVRMMIYDSGDIHLEYETGRSFYTKENVKTGGKMSLVVKIDDGLLFHNNFLKSRSKLSKSDIVDFIRGEIDHILSGFIVSHSFEELYGNLDLRTQLLNKLDSELRTTLRRSGMDLVHIPYFDYDEGAWEEIKDKSGDLELARRQMKVEIDARNLEYERKRAETDLALREALLKEEFEIKEAVARAEMRQKGDEELEEVAQARRLLGLKILSRETAVEMQRLNTEEERLAFIDRLDEKRTLSQQQKLELVRAIDEKNEDHDMARDIFVKKTRLMNEQEFDLLNQRFRHELRAQGLKNDKEIQDLEHQLLRGGALNQGDLEKIRVQNDYDVDAVRIELERRRREFERQQAVADAKAEREVDKLEIETYKDMKSAQLEVKAQSQLIEERALEAEHKRKLEFMEQANRMGPAALAMCADDNERAAMLADLAKTDAFKGMSPEQILAASKDTSPEVAAAFAEKFKMAALQTERMLQMKDEHIADMRNFAAGAQQGLVHVENTRAENPVHTNVAMSPGMGGGFMAWPGAVAGAGMAQGGAQKQEEKKFCTKCGKQQPVDARFCSSCGHSFPGME